MALRSGSVWPAAIAHGVNNTCCRLMFWFVRPPLELLIGPAWAGIIGSLGYFIIALPIFIIPGALAPKTSAGTIKPNTGQVMQGSTG